MALSTAQPVSTKPVLSTRELSKRFVSDKRTTQALNAVSIDVQPGTVTGLIGPDGAGKTTLMRLVAGLLLPNNGAITVLDVDGVADPLAVQQLLGYMPQRFGLYEDLTVQENLDLYADLHGVPVAERPARYEELMKMTGMAPFTKRLAGNLSGGMKQKLGLACVLVHPPSLLLLDEPTVGVDPVSRRELWDIVYRLVEQDGMTVMLSTAYLDEAERCSDVILMHRGEVLGQGPPEHFSKPMAGRCFSVNQPGMNRRSLQVALAETPGVIDATIRRHGVRVVMEHDKAPSPDVAQASEIQVHPADPTFEDGFIALLQDKDGNTAPPVTSLGNSARVAEQGSDDVIVVEGVKRRFGDFYAVKGISFSVHPGEVFGLLGANGAGKSTTFRMLCGPLPATHGSLQVAGRNLRKAPADARARIGYMAQHFSLYGDLSVIENLRFFSSTYGLSGKQQKEQIRWALDEFELEQYRNHTSKNLPLGYKQRLALAAALMHRPQIIFLDEPTSGVDPLARREFWFRIARLAEEGVTVLVTTHFMEEAEYCDRLVIMAQGEILAEGTPDDMCARARTSQCPNPTMEDAFIQLIEQHQTEAANA